MGGVLAEKSFLNVALFLSFFPKQVCGPIVNGRDFLPQLKENRVITLKNIEIGIQIFVFGLFKKIVLADHLAVFVDGVYAVPSAYGTATIWLAAFSYLLQLYFDFSGYSDMAIGMSKIFGYDIARNFNLPFVARNISEYWNRWHISLSSWLNEYVFNPVAIYIKRKMASLPKEKKRKYKMVPNYVAIFITFFISGIWHGAGFTFIVFGLCHGICSIVQEIFRNWKKKEKKNKATEKRAVFVLLSILGNYVAVTFFQVFFRAESLRQAFYILQRMFSVHAGIEQPYVWSFFAYFLLVVAIIAAYIRKSRKGLKEVEGFYPILSLRSVKGLAIFFTFCGLTLILAYFGETYFIYGNF